MGYECTVKEKNETMCKWYQFKNKTQGALQSESIHHIHDTDTTSQEGFHFRIKF